MVQVSKRVDQAKAREMSKGFVDQLRRSNPEPTGELKVSEQDYERLEKSLVRKILEVAG